jgi:TonB family protein
MFLTRSSRIAMLSILLVLVAFPLSAQQVSMVDTRSRDQGIELYKNGDLKGAIKALLEAVKLDPNDAIAWYHLGLAYYQADKNKDARKALETAAMLRPDDSAIHTALSYTLLLANKLSEARQEANRAITLNERNAGAHYVRGVVNIRAGEFAEARKAAERALQIEPDMPHALLLKSQVLVNMLSYASMKPDKKPFPDTRLDNSDYLLLKEAAQSLEKYLSLSPNDSDAKEWRKQLATLQVYADLAVDKSPRDESPVLRPNDVTTKAKILSKPAPVYTENARNAQVSGTVVLQMILGADGTIRHILVLRWLSHGLVNQAEKAARQIKFIPASRDGRPVSQYIRVEYNFSIY